MYHRVQALEHYLKRVLLCLFVLISSGASGQQANSLPSFENLQLKIDSLLPSEYPEWEYRGDIVQGIRWTDKRGEHYLVLTETGVETVNEEDATRSAFIVVYHFLKTKKDMKRIWTFTDFVVDCPVDIQANFLENGIRITDLDKDGHGEIWILYRLACKGDISPSEFNILLHSRENEHVSMSGSSKLIFPDGAEDGGEYTFDEGFKALSGIFRDYGKWLWEQNVLEPWAID